MDVSTIRAISIIISAIIFIIILVLVSIIVVKKDTPEPEKNPPEPFIYKKVRPFIYRIKIILQMSIGFGLMLLIIIKFIHHLAYFFDQTSPNPNANDFLSKYVYNLPTLDIVGLALAYSSAIELAHTLFTPGPDEAIEPLIIGLASVILLVISHMITITFDNASGVVLLALVLIALFILRYLFIGEKGWVHLRKLIHLLKGSVADKQRLSVPASSGNVQSQKPSGNIKVVAESGKVTGELPASDIGKFLPPVADEFAPYGSLPNEK